MDFNTTSITCRIWVVFLRFISGLDTNFILEKFFGKQLDILISNRHVVFFAYFIINDLKFGICIQVYLQLSKVKMKNHVEKLFYFLGFDF